MHIMHVYVYLRNKNFAKRDLSRECIIICDLESCLLVQDTHRDVQDCVCVCVSVCTNYTREREREIGEKRKKNTLTYLLLLCLSLPTSASKHSDSPSEPPRKDGDNRTTANQAMTVIAGAQNVYRKSFRRDRAWMHHCSCVVLARIFSRIR